MRAQFATSQTRRRWLSTTALIVPAALAVLGASAAEALPAGGTVTQGAASIQSGANSVTVQQGSNRAVINWNSFSTAAGQTVNFKLPSASSAVLNRVTGSSISRLAGALTSNGQVFLINRNGIIITPTGTVQTSGFVASSLDITNANFMAGVTRLSGAGAGEVVNQGSITAAPGSAVALLGSSVSNQGLISAPLGAVALGSGQAATLDFSGNGLLQVALPTDVVGPANQALISNSGHIVADGGTVVIKAATALDAVRRTVNMSGVITAQGVSGHDGAVVLDAGAGGDATVSGTIDVSGPVDGGRIDLTAGDTLSLVGANLMATGVDSGGLIRVGGMFQGGNTLGDPASLISQYSGRFGAVGALDASDNTLIDTNSTISASGGNVGGTVVVWSDQTTQQQGLITTAGALGGAIEVSSHNLLSANPTKIRTGAGGTVLFDPANIIVDTASDIGYDGGTATSYAGDVNYDASSATSYFDSAQIETVLDAGTNVILKASNNISFSNVNVGFTANPGSIFLSAGGIVSLGYINLGNSNLTVIANDTAANGVVASQRQAGKAGIDTFNASPEQGDVSLFGGTGSGGSGGNISLTISTGLAAGTAGNMRLDGITTNGTGNITLSTSDQSSSTIEFFPNDSIAGNAIAAVPITAAGVVTLTGNLMVGTSGGLPVTGQTVTWTDENTSTITGYNGGVVSFTEVSSPGQPGVVTRYGIMYQPAGGGEGGHAADQTRVSLGQGGTDPQYVITYGGALPTYTQAHIAAGALQVFSGVTDTFANALTDLSNLTTVGPAAGSGAGTYNVTTTAIPNLAGTDPGYFFNLTPAVDTIQIAQKLVTPTLVAGSYTYGSPTALISLSGVINGDSVQPLSSLDGSATSLSVISAGYGFAPTVGAGSHSYALTGLTGTGAGNYTLGAGAFTSTLSIAQEPLTYTAGNVTSTYGTTAGASTITLTGVVNNDALTPTVLVSSSGGGAVMPAANTPVGSYVISVTGVTGAAASDYLLSTTGNTNGALTIDPKALTYAAVAVNSTYGTLASVATPTLSGVLPGDNVVASTLLNGAPPALTATTNAGVYAITPALSGTSVSNYALATVGNTQASLTIAPKPLTIALVSGSQVYGSPVTVVTESGVLSSDDVRPNLYDTTILNGVTLASSGGGAYYINDKEVVGLHTFTFAGLSGASASNYTATVPGTLSLTVTPATLTYSIGTSTSEYGVYVAAPTPTFNTAYGDVISGTVVATVQGASTTVALNTPFNSAHVPAGAYVLSVAGPLTGYFAADYNLATSGNTTGLLTVTPRPVSYSVGTYSSTYGTLFSPPNGNLTGVLGADSVSGIVTASQGGSPVTLAARSATGNYVLSVTALSGAQASDYAISSTGDTDGALTIAPLAITYSLSAATSVYGTLANPAAPTITGVLSGDSVGGVIVASSGGTTQASLAARSPAGTYTLSLSGLTGANAADYSIASSGDTTGTLVINPKSITYSSANATSVYGTPETPGAFTLSGVLTGDTVAATSPLTGLVQSVGTYSETGNGLSGANAGDYAINTAQSKPGTYVVTAKALTGVVTLNYATTLYGSGLSASNITYNVTASSLTGVVGQDQVYPSVTVATATPITTSSAGLINVGAYNFSVTGLQGSGAGNYILGSSNSVTFTITPRPIEAISSSSSSTYGTLASFAAPILTNEPFMTGLASGDQVVGGGFTLSNATGAPVALSATTSTGAYSIGVTTLTGADAKDYSIGSVAPATLTINPKPLTYSAVSAASTYGTLATLPAASLKGIVGSDQVQGVYGLAASLTSQTNAGTYTLAVTGLTGAQASDYTVAVTGDTNASLVISPKPLSYTVTKATQSVVYGTSVASPIQLVGILPGDTVNFFTMPTVTAKPSGDTYITVGDGNNPLEYAPLLPVATYGLNLETVSGYSASVSTSPIYLGGASAANYTLANPGSAALATLTITPRPLTYGVTLAAPTEVYGTPDTATVSLGNVAPGTTLNYSLVATNGGAARSLGNGATLPANLNAGVNVIGLQPAGADAFNYSVSSGATAALTISPKPITAVLTAQAATYGTPVADIVELPGLLAGDTVAPTMTLVDGTTTSVTLSPSTPGYGFASAPNAGSASLTLASLSGAQAGNYSLTNTGASIQFTIAQKSVNFSVAPVTGAYGGITAPSCSFPGCELDTGTNLSVGAATLTGVLPGDKVTPNVQLTDNTSIFNYATNTPAGTYIELVTSLSGASAANYKIAGTGNTAGLMTINPGYIQVSVSSGGIVYDGSTTTVVGTPGIATVKRSNSGGTNGSPGTFGFLPGDDVTVEIGIFTSNGSPYTGGQPLPVGDYLLEAVGLTGAQAGDYKLLPQTVSQGPGEPLLHQSTPGTYTVVDNSIFDFSFLSSQPNQAYTPPPPPVVTATGSASATAGGSAGVGTAYTSVSAQGQANVSATGTVSAGPVSLSGTVYAGTTALASFGVTGLTLSGSADAGATVTLQVGPAYASLGVEASAAGTISFSPLGSFIDASAALTTTATVGVGGTLGGGVSGSASVQGTAFTEAFSNTDIGLEGTTLTVGEQEFVGAGESVGTTVGLSGDGVSGSVGVTVYSPGSLYIGARSSTGYSDGTVSIGFTLGIAIGIGGLQITPDISFPVAPIINLGEGVGSAFQYVFTGGGGSSCNASCQQAAAAQAAYTAAETGITTASKLANKGVPTLAEVAYLAANPSVVAQANADAKNYNASDWVTATILAKTAATYGAIPAQMNSVLAQEQALDSRLQRNPASITPADLTLAESLRSQEASLISQVNQLGGKIAVVNGALTMEPAGT